VFLGLAYGVPDEAIVITVAIDERSDVMLSVDGAKIVLRKLRMLRALSNRAHRVTSESCGTLGNVICIVVKPRGETVEELVAGDELRALDVPMGLLDL
jgi:hypothetical protein